MLSFMQRREKALQERIILLENRVTRLTDERDELIDTGVELKAKNKQLAQTRQMEDEMIAHKLKMREETVELSAEKRISAAERKAFKQRDEAIAETKDEYRDKVENQLEKRGDELKEMYTEVLARLPDINVELGGKIAKK